MIPKRQIIPIFVPHMGCPNDCVFCNQRSISGRLQPATPEVVAEVIENADRFMIKDAPIQLAFYGGSFTAISAESQNDLLGAAAAFLINNKNASLRLSTRPDCIDSQTLKRLARYGVKTVELGAQSMCDDVLIASGRGHTAQDTQKAAHLVREAGMELILQMMTGLPGDTPEKALQTARDLIALSPDGVRIYPTVVLRGTKLYDLWQRGEYSPQTVDDAISLCAELYDLFIDTGITIIRMGLNPSEDLSGGEAAAGVYHPAFGELVLSRVYLKQAQALLRDKGTFRKVTLGVPKGRVSCMVGHKRCNIEALHREFGPISVTVTQQADLSGEIVIMCIEK